MDSIKKLIKELRSNVIQTEGRRRVSIDKYIAMRKTVLKDIKNSEIELEKRCKKLDSLNDEVFDLIEQNKTIEYVKVKIKSTMKIIGKYNNNIKKQTQKKHKYESIIDALRNSSEVSIGVYIHGDKNVFEEQIKDALLDLGEYTERNGYSEETDNYKETLWNLLGLILNDSSIISGFATS